MGQITDDDLRWLLTLLEEEPLAELEVAVGEDRVLLRRAETTTSPVSGAPVSVSGGAVASGGAQMQEASARAAANGEELFIPRPEFEVVRAPMGGVFYRRPAPDKPPYVEPDDEVHVGDTIGLIEAMKLFNEVTSHVHGRLVRFLVEDAQAVEADAPLALIEPLYGAE